MGLPQLPTVDFFTKDSSKKSLKEPTPKGPQGSLVSVKVGAHDSTIRNLVKVTLESFKVKILADQ